MHGDLIGLNRSSSLCAAQLHYTTHYHLLLRGSQGQQLRTQSIKLKEKSMESDGDKQEMLQQTRRGCFFSI